MKNRNQNKLINDNKPYCKYYENFLEPCNSKFLRYDYEHRDFIESLWEKYEPYADHNFRQHIKTDFLARFFEMYLAVSIISRTNYTIKQKSKKSKGPDICINHNSKTVWIECITPTNDKEEQNIINEPKLGVVCQVPDEKLILAIRSAIKTKKEKIKKYISNGTINKDDYIIIAVSLSNLPYKFSELYPPRIVQATYGIGYPQVTFNRNTKEIEHSYQKRQSIVKKNGISIPTDIFLSNEYSSISGILCSLADPFNKPDAVGDDVVFVHNHAANNKLPVGFFSFGEEWYIHQQDELRRKNY